MMVRLPPKSSLAPPLLLMVFAAALTPGAAAARVASPLAAMTLDLGRAISGESCRADSAWDDAVAKARRFDRAFDVQCRGWTDTQSAGRLYALANRPAAAAALAAARETRLLCGAPVAIEVPGVGRGEARRCTDREGSFPALAVTAVRGGTLYAAEGLDRFNANLAAGLRQLAGAGRGNRRGGAAAGGFALCTAAEPVKSADARAGSDGSTLAGRWREAVGYTVRGQNVEAREIVARSEGRLPPGTSAADRAGLKLEAALSESNLGNHALATAQLDQAEALLAAAGTAPNGFLGAKLMVYRAMVALNRRDYPIALASAAHGYAAATALSEAADTDRSGAGNPLRTAAVLRELNAQPGGQRPEMLRAEAQYVRGAALRQTGRPADASAALTLAAASVAAITRTGVETSNLQWLQSQIAVEQGRALLAGGKPDAARATAIAAKLRESVECLERSGAYAGSPLLAQRKLGYAGFLADHGDPATALRQYDEAVAIMRNAGPSATTGGEPLEAYFKLLAADGAGGGAAADAARAKFFLASQLVNPPLVATQIAQIQRIFEAGGSQGAVLAKTLQDLDREGRSLQAQSAALKPDAVRDRDRLAVAIAINDGRISEVRGQLGKDQKYLQVNDSPVTLADLQAALKPGEAYAKVLTLARTTYVLVATRDRALVYPVALPTPKLAALERQVRASIDGRKTATGGAIVLVFDVEKASQLHTLMFDPAATLLKDATSLVAEPTGALSELPIGVLVTDPASVDRWKVTVTKNSRDYSDVAFLAKRYDLDTSVSPRAFLIARQAPVSRAPNPYIGFGNHALATPAELATLGRRGGLGERCAARADALRGAYASLAPIGAKELAAAAAAAGAGSDLVEAERFTDSALTSAAPGTFARYAVVHFATHGIKEGELGCDNPPALVTSIAPDGDSDGMLSFDKVANMQFDANLIVLSACNTAASTSVTRAIAAGGFRSGAAGQSAAFNGLVRAFLTAGGRAVLTTHWAIPDTLTARDGTVLLPSTLLMDRLFVGGKTATIAGALRQAQTERIRQIETSHPYYWGAFAIVGDGDKFMFARAS